MYKEAIEIDQDEMRVLWRSKKKLVSSLVVG
jgi:hypothetical protein